MTTLPGVAGLEITTPESWWDLPLEPQTRRDDIARLVGERAEREPGLAPRRAELAEMLCELADRAAAAGAVLSSQMAAPVPGGYLAANLLVVVRRLAGSGASLLAGVQALDGPVDGTVAGAVGRGTSEVSAVELMWAGSGVRRRTRQRTAGQEGDGEVLLVQYFVPVPRSALTTMLTFTSPAAAPAAADALAEAFGSIAGTLTFVDAEGRAVPPWTPARA